MYDIPFGRLRCPVRFVVLLLGLFKPINPKHTFLLATVATVSVAYVAPKQESDGGTKDEEKKELSMQEIVINDLKTTTPHGQARSGGATVDVYYVPGSGLEFYFNPDYLLGTVTIDVTDASGASIATRSCNTDTEPSVCLPVVLTTDNSYSIRIVGPDYEGVGTIL